MPIQPVKNRKRRKHAAPIGGIFVALAIIGIVTIIVTSINLTSRFLDNSSAKTELENTVRPLVMFDSVPFESPSDIEPQQLLLFSMWSIFTTERPDSYIYDESGALRVPASDLEVAAGRLFGTDIVVEHQTFDDNTTRYYYNPDDNVYNIPVSADLYVYSPVVVSIERGEGDLYNVTVGYTPPSDAWTTDFSGNLQEPEPEKYMTYVMRRERNSYQIVALRDSDVAQPVYEFASESSIAVNLPAEE